ncbi:MAG: class I SAM-dependent methyltransferase [SAR202 cluster bacterium]|jgi:SAM-dependent methyltransferase|nr:class I SAM-dependent methyltransferase [SAR202 cluster bacterium]MDP6514763.1 class I SAM-dependent methyltransferase [SAR202 cluster bacterium]MDP6716591.1 class I SAM-dependent methyltransferase [SAR202 cluster bacterium]
MIYSHYSALMAKSMSANRPLPDEGEYEYLLKHLQECEGRALELACGYGRLLLYIMEQGWPIVGTDASPEMMAHCQTLAKEKNLVPELHCQFMQRLELDETFGFIFISDGTFSLIIEDQDIHDLFQRVWEHLKPGGSFPFDFFTYPPTMEFNTPLKRGDWVTAPDGSILVTRKLERYDPETHIRDCLQMHDLYVDGKFVESQAYEDPMRYYDPTVLMDYLAGQGFIDISLGGFLTDAPPEENAAIVSIRCKKPAE